MRQVAGRARRGHTARHSHDGRPGDRARTQQPDGRAWGRAWAALLTLKGAVLSAGALAVAVAAIAALIPRTEPLEVRFTSMQVSRALVPASQFRATEASFAPGPRALGRWHGDQVRLVAQPALVTTSPASSGSGTVSDPPSESPTESPSLSEPSPTPSPSETPSLSPSATPSGGLTDSPTPGPAWRPARHLADVLNRARDAGVKIDPAPPSVPMRSMLRGQTVNADGTVVPPEEAVRRLVEVLSDVRKTPVSAKGQRKSEPLGVTVRANVQLEHAKGRSVRIFWELSDAADGQIQALSSTWLRGHAAYRVVATSDRDSGSFKIWVPVPVRKGDYLLTLYARTKGGGLPLDDISSDTLVH